ncbi:MAG: TetR/AcrR family transcriptional regulator [Dichotomicrobium sp.]
MQSKALADARRRDTKAMLRRAALEQFASRGYSAVSMRDIAAEVGLRQGGIYNHFASKQELLVDLMRTHMNALLEALDTALASVDGRAAQLEAFARFHVRYHIDHPDDAFIAYMELRSLEPEGYTIITRLRDHYEGTLRAILAEGSEAGLFRLADAAVHARALLSMLTGVTVWYRDGGRLSRDEVVDAYAQAALQSVGLPPTQGGIA